MSDAAWQAVGAVVVAFITALGTVLVSRKEKTPAPLPPSAERRAVEAVTGESTDGMSEQLVRMLARAYSEIERVSHRWDEAVDHATQVHDWIDDGCLDPPGRPPRPAWAPRRPR